MVEFFAELCRDAAAGIAAPLYGGRGQSMERLKVLNYLVRTSPL